MKWPALPPSASLLLVGLLFPGFSRAFSVNHLGADLTRDPKELSLGQGAERSHLSYHRVKRFLPPRVPPYYEPEPDYQIIDCKMNEGYCQEYCNFMETQLGYCSKRKDACCVHHP